MSEALATYSALFPGLVTGPGKPAILTLEVARSWTSEVLGGLAPLVLGEGRTLYCADGANCFDPYAFSLHARQRGFDPSVTLDRVFLTRCFTIHQLEAVAGEMLRPLARLDPPPLVAVLGLDHLFLEETLPLGERRQVLGRVLGHIAAMRAEGAMVLVTHDPPRAGRGWWRSMVRQVGDVHAAVRGGALPANGSNSVLSRGRGSPFGAG